MISESEASFDNDIMVDVPFSIGRIDPGRARFPCCLVWTPLPVISWFIPFIGHLGICREDGVILDFAGPNFVCVDNFTFGAVARYIQLNQEKCCLYPVLSGYEPGNAHKKTGPNDITSWDDALKKGTQEFQHRNYSLFTCNCHSFVANNLNRMRSGGNDGWNVVNLAVFMFFKGKWVSNTAASMSLLPFVVVCSLGFLFGGSNFMIFMVAFLSILVGWFVVGTYCFKNLIQL